MAIFLPQLFGGGFFRIINGRWEPLWFKEVSDGKLYEKILHHGFRNLHFEKEIFKADDPQIFIDVAEVVVNECILNCIQNKKALTS